MLEKIMYKKTNPQQMLFDVDSQLSPTLRDRLKSSWAQFFRKEVLPILLRSEDQYAMLYGKTGRPNFSVARLLGLCLLQEWNDLSDQQALDTFGFDIRWRYALDVCDEGDYLSRRSLVEFRRRLVSIDPEMNLIRSLFDTVRDSALKKLNLSFSNQRLDSTHVISNIRIRGRMDLFSNTLRVFLKSLDKDRFKLVPESVVKWYASEPEGWFGLGPAQQKVKLDQLAHYLYELIVLFEKDDDIRNSEPYSLLERLFHEQCEMPSGKDVVESTGIKLKAKTKGETLQSPYDPDASYGHKGAGYSVHITETCHNPGKPEIITDYEAHGAARSDVAKMISVLERLESAGLKPETLFADGGYPSVPSAFKVMEQEIDFMTPVNRGRVPDDKVGRDSFEFDSDGLVTRCPKGHRPADHRILSSHNTTRQSLHAVFDGDICRSCNALDKCPVRAPNHRDQGCLPKDTIGNFRLEITPELRLRDQMYAIQQTTEWKDRYSIRSGIEATISELKRAHGIGRLRVRRAVKICFAIACKVTACNIKRWARAHTGCYGKELQRLLSIFFEYLNILEVNLNKI